MKHKIKAVAIGLTNKLRSPKGQRFLLIAAPMIILAYLGIGLLAYVHLFPGSTALFSASSLTGVAARAFTLLLIVLLTLATYIAFRPKVQWGIAYAFGILLLCNYVMVFVTPHSYATLYYSQIYSYGEYFVTSVSNRSLFISSLSSFADFVFGICLLTVLPQAFPRRKQFLIVFIPFVVFMAFQCIYTFIAERTYYVELIGGTSPYYLKPLTAMFSSKQELGIFLTPAFCLCPILSWLIHKESWPKLLKVVSVVFLGLVAFLFFVISVFSLCKTAILGNMFILLFSIAGFVLWLLKKGKRLFPILIISLFVGSIAGLVVFMSVPALHEDGFGKSVYYIIANQILNRLDRGSWSRMNIVAAYFDAVPMQNLFFGFGKGLQDIYGRSLAPILRYGIHTGAVIFLANYGIISTFLVAVLLLRTLFRRAARMWQSPFVSSVVIGTFVAAIILNIAELEILIFSSSVTVFLFNFIIFVFGESSVASAGGAKIALNEGKEVLHETAN